MTDSNDTPKPKRKRVYQPKRHCLNIKLPNDLMALCAREQIEPSELVRGFIADLCDIRAWTTSSRYAGNGDAAHQAALAYHRVASQARQHKAQPVDASTPQPLAETRATTPIEALAQAVRKDKP